MIQEEPYSTSTLEKSIAKSVDLLINERIQKFAELENVTGELLNVRAQRDMVLKSKSLKVSLISTWPLRRLKSALRH